MQIGRLFEVRFTALPGGARAGQVALTVLVISALAALFLAHHMVWVVVPALFSVLSLLFRLESISRWAIAAVQYAFYACLGGTVVLAYLFMVYPILSQQRANQLTLVESLALAGFALGFLFGAGVWRLGAAVIPCVLGMFVVAGFNGTARLEPVLALGGAAGVTFLAVEKASHAGRGAAPLASRFKWRLVFVLLPTLLVAAAIIWALPRAQTRVESATFGLMSSSTTSYSSFMSESRLGDLERLQLSDKVVFRVWSSNPQKLRGRIFIQFDGRAWRAPRVTPQQLQSVSEISGLDPATAEWLQEIPGTSYVLPVTEYVGVPIRTKIVQSGFNPGLLVSPGGQMAVRADASTISADLDQTLTTPLSASPETYGILNHRSGDLVQPGTAPPALLAETVRTPERLDQRLAVLARLLGGEMSSPEDRIRRTVRFVQNECHYSLDVGKFHSQDPVAEFLFEKKRGYCEYFASAAAVLLRLQGIPCRYVTGFVVQEWNRQGGHFVVREADAHAWIEAYVPGRGWIEVDATPDAEYAAARARFKSGWFDQAEEWAAGVLSEAAVYWRHRDLTGLFRWLWHRVRTLAGILWSPATIVVILFIAGTILAARLLSKPTSSWGRAQKTACRPAGIASAEVQALLAYLDETWSQRGVSRPPSRAPLEHIVSLPPGKIADELRDASLKAVEYFYRVTFGHAQPEHEAVENLRRAFERARTS